jgi:hypothetical protein
MRTPSSPSVALTRRRFSLGLGAALAFSTSARAIVPERYTSLMRRVMGLHWRGRLRFDADFIEGGEFISQLDMDFSLDANWDFTGKMVEKMQWGDTIYSGLSAIWGNCWVIGNEAGLSITRMRNISGDTLPNNFAWGTSTGDFRFHNDTDRPGHFIIQGVMRSDRDGTISKVSMIDV